LCKHLYTAINAIDYGDFIEKSVNKKMEELKRGVVDEPIFPPEEDIPVPPGEDSEDYRDFLNVALDKRFGRLPKDVTWNDIAKEYGIKTGDAARLRTLRAIKSVRDKGATSPYVQKTLGKKTRVKGVPGYREWFDDDFFKRLFEVIP
jgi:hypothetical protein